jgi:hypothetical protein
MRNDLETDDVAHDGIGGMLSRLANRAKVAIADARQRRALRRELADCAMNGELDTILADVGLTRGDIEPLIKGHPEAARLFRAMLGRLGLEKEYSRDSNIHREMERTCSLCDEHGRCRGWLHTGRKDGYHDFCPNADLLDFLRQRAAARSKATG